MDLSDKKILIIIAFDEFQDIEYREVRKVLENDNAEITVASSKAGQARGKLGNIVNIKETIYTISPKDYDTVIFIGGPGAEEYFENHRAYQICHETLNHKKILAAICIAPVILAKAGVLKGKKATVWSGPMDKSAIKILEENGAIYTPESVVVDGKIVTAEGPAVAGKFAESLIKILE